MKLSTSVGRKVEAPAWPMKVHNIINITQLELISFGLEGHKSFVLTHLNYLVMISPPMVPSASAASATVRHVARAANSVDSEITKVTVFDLENKFVAFSGTFTQGVSRVFSGYNKIYVLLTDGQVRYLIPIQVYPYNGPSSYLLSKRNLPRLN